MQVVESRSERFPCVRRLLPCIVELFFECGFLNACTWTAEDFVFIRVAKHPCAVVRIEPFHDNDADVPVARIRRHVQCDFRHVAAVGPFVQRFGGTFRSYAQARIAGRGAFGA